MTDNAKLPTRVIVESLRDWMDNIDAPDILKDAIARLAEFDGDGYDGELDGEADDEKR